MRNLIIQSAGIILRATNYTKGKYRGKGMRVSAKIERIITNLVNGKRRRAHCRRRWGSE